MVRTLQTLTAELERLGHGVIHITPDRFASIPCPTYPEIRLAVLPGRKVARMIEEAHPCAIHIATEGPLGLAARNYCARRGIPFTTAYHTRFPEYVKARFGLPRGVSYAFLRWFHRPSSSIMVATASIESELRSRGFANMTRWGRGVDLDLFHPRDKSFLDGPRPVLLYVGRVAVEKNIEAFLQLELPGTKYVVGDGPLLSTLKAKYPDVRFAGVKAGEELAAHYAAADVMVFPSLTDTFGLVVLEALASGVPVAAFPVAGPQDILTGSGAGCLDADLAKAVKEALAISPGACLRHARRYSWAFSAEQFLCNLAPFETLANPRPLPV